MGRRWRNKRRSQRWLLLQRQRQQRQQQQQQQQQKPWFQSVSSDDDGGGGQFDEREDEEEEQVNLGHQDFSPEVITLLRWLKENGFRNEHRLQVFQYGDRQGRGICARRGRLAVGDELMLLPSKCMLLPSVLRQEKPELYEHFEIDEDCLIAVLMYERARIDAGLSSFWAPYLNTITRDYDYLPLMEANVLQRYATLPVPSSYYRLVSATLIDLERTRVRVSDIITLNKLPILYDHDAFNWAYSVVNTRSVHPNPLMVNSAAFQGDDIALVPFFDIFNHAPSGNAQVQTSCPEGFQMVTHKSFPRYSQVYINYHDDVSNREFYVFYGFTPIQGTWPASSDSRLLKVTPCPQDIINIPYTKLEAILIQTAERFPEYRHLKERIVERLNMLVQMNFINAHEDTFYLRWPRTLLNNVSVQFVDDCITFKEAGKVYECLDLTALNSNVDTSLEILFTLLAKTKFENVKKKRMNNFITAAAAVSRYKHKQAASKIGARDSLENTLDATSPLVCYEEELSIRYSLKKMLLRGYMKNEYGFDATIPLTPVLVNQYLEQLSSLEKPLKMLFRNELGLLLFHSYQIEQTMPC